MLAVGAIAERGRLGPIIFFIFWWSTLVYDPIACWTWNAGGWASQRGVLDFAGGTPVHISSGTAGLAISIYLGELVLFFSWFFFGDDGLLIDGMSSFSWCFGSFLLGSWDLGGHCLNATLRHRTSLGTASQSTAG